MECSLVLSLNHLLTATPTSSSSKRRGKRLAAAAAAKVNSSDLQIGSTLLATVEHKTDYYFVVSCNTLSGARLAYGVIDTVRQCYVYMQKFSVYICKCWRELVCNTMCRVHVYTCLCCEITVSVSLRHHRDRSEYCHLTSRTSKLVNKSRLM